MNTTENAPSAKKLQMIINSGISKNSINELHLKAIPRILTVLESILKGCELRFRGHLGVHRMSLGCFESDSKNIFISLVIKAIRE